MKQDSTEIIKRYLLGSAADVEREFVEKSLSDPAFEDNFTVTEDSLISEYNWDRLPPAERALFESNYMNLSGSREKVAFNKAIFESIRELEPAAATRSLPTSQARFYWAKFRTVLMPTVGAVAAALLLIFAAGAFFRISRDNNLLQSKIKDMEEKLKQAEANENQKRNEFEAFRRELENQKKIDEESARQTEIEKAAQADRKSGDTKKALPAPNSPDNNLLARNINAAVDLTPYRGNLSNGESSRSIRITPRTKTVIINLTLPGTAGDSSYKVEISDSSGNVTFSQSNLKSQGRKVSIKIPSEKLAAGETTVILYRLVDQGESREVAGYRFVVNKD